ncbi:MULTISPECIES: methionine--tRNA ligase [unclassified Undibacterium]|uniref:methionine--tRNA ligase n=1 Tax=unclassified Undibacterium TaxID=2630295 RepID=UPI002AC8D505|nr:MULTISPECIES: methionine--tRNA ligase [unclassified Undibacterium]MEB0141222.1 methionine--tRNA ligase [Undibacterium sp. CCC2.1]MEB0174291.1 methionine--tRNA ligase [Undibacterium sp. CCC1.1]MEB0178225.1 methionine--tRNA ligase [Undibacterium sp. CCC3.4]MEB0217427.1 methionine--tRNA ligase [Undibacterium sp. 5I2]WPX44594.1 methionine--tRNA ligase [Undibacterium sp. CCC3.4]
MSDTSNAAARPLYLTTPIYYVNDRPHLGHAYASIHADVVARYGVLEGRPTVFITGADEHGEKIAKAAAAMNEPIQAFVDYNAAAFRHAWEQLSVAPTAFVRTTDPAHKAYVSAILQLLHDKGDIYEAEYEGLYSVGQERYVTQKELVDGKLPEDKEPPQLRRETNYFFRMEKYRESIRELLRNQPDLIHPKEYAAEVRKLLEEPIGDLSISRPIDRVSWGIPLPWDHAHVTYVWFDALLSYVSELRKEEGRFDRFWPHTRHIIGKDILRPHALFWLSMCLAIGLPPYRRLHVSGHLLGSDGRKMSKSLGNGVDPLDAARKYGVDVLRYVLIREVPFGVDGIISEQVIEQRLRNDLANDFGNLAARTLAMIGRYREGRVPAASDLGDAERRLQTESERLRQMCPGWVEDLWLSHGVEEILEFVRSLNRYVSEQVPWALAKQPDQQCRLDTVLNTLHQGLVTASTLLFPVMPGKMSTLRTTLGLTAAPSLSEFWTTTGGQQVDVEAPVLFPKMGDD